MGDAFFELPEYQLLHRVIKEQSNGNPDGTRTAKNGGDIATDSLQNPSDPDATFREKAGRDYKGYTGHVVENFDGEGNPSLRITDTKQIPTVTVPSAKKQLNPSASRKNL